jgi:hypothetical protein
MSPSLVPQNKDRQTLEPRHLNWNSHHRTVDDLLCLIRKNLSRRFISSSTTGAGRRMVLPNGKLHGASMLTTTPWSMKLALNGPPFLLRLGGDAGASSPADPVRSVHTSTRKVDIGAKPA